MDGAGFDPDYKPASPLAKTEHDTQMDPQKTGTAGHDVSDSDSHEVLNAWPKPAAPFKVSILALVRSAKA